MASERRGGIFSLVAGGISLTVEGEASHSAQRFQRESVNSLTKGRAGHKRTPATPFMEVTVFSGQNVDHEALEGLEGVLAQMDFYDGTSFTLYEADQVGTIEVNDAEGTFTLRLEGNRGKRFGVVTT